MHYFGIDFGTTNTAVVWVNEDEYGRKPAFLGEDGDYPFSSIVAIPKNAGELRFGRKVREQRLALSETHDVYTSMKPFLGTSKSFVVGDEMYSPSDITAAFFRHIKDHIKQRYTDGNGDPIDITAASLSFPVDFSPEARKALFAAAAKAGIQVKAFVSESTAAYIANRSAARAFSKVMVLDWGGGTIDISILHLTGTSVHEISTWGERIGGDDIDLELAQRIHSKIANESKIDGGRFEDMQPHERDQMLMRCEEAKISISDEGEEYPLTVRNYGAYGTKNTTLTEELFDAIVEPIIRTRILKAINDALIKAGNLSPASIDGVIIVGGSSNLRQYETAITNLFGIDKIIFPKERQWSAATGAALMQIIGGSLRLSDTVGVKLSDDSVFPILPKDSAINVPIAPITFSLTEDALDARFIFTDGSGKHIYGRRSVPTKGFLKEELVLCAEIGYDQVARITIENMNFTHANQRTLVELSKLTFHYDIAALG